MNLGRLVFPALRWRAATGFSHEQAAIDEALALGVGGFIVFGVGGARADEIAALTDALRRRAGRPLLNGADLERGAGQQARRLTPCPPPGALASLEDDAVLRWAGGVTGREAREIGINWIFAPVADLDLEPDNPIVQTRSFGTDPTRVGHAVSQWIDACQAEGVIACAKHYPGHGRTVHDSHQRLPSVGTALAELESTDLRPFGSAVRAGVGSVMTSHVAFPSWDAGGAPATRSPVILGYLRQKLGFDGLIVTDAFIMEGAKAGKSEADAAVASLAAGCDVLLYPGDLPGTLSAILAAVQHGTLQQDQVAASLARYDHALERVTNAEPRSTPFTVTADDVAQRLLANGLQRGPVPALRDGIRLTVVDDDVGGWYAPGPSDIVLRTLAKRGITEEHNGQRIVLAFAEPRAAKGRAGFGPESLARLSAVVPGAALTVLFGHPRLAEQIPAVGPLLVAWHRQDLMQRAVAGWLAGRVQGSGSKVPSSHST
jgi:beta-glucosidase